MVRGVVRERHPDDGWGVIDSPQTPGACWAHHAHVQMTGFRALSVGQTAEIVWESPGQDGFPYRAVTATPT